MRMFQFRHLFFNTENIHAENDLPSWLIHKSNKWFLENHVLTLEIGQFVDTDFQRITRVS